MNAELPKQQTRALPTGTVLRAPSAFIRGRSPRIGWLVRSGLAGTAALAGSCLLAKMLRDGLRKPDRDNSAAMRPHRRAAIRLSEGAALLSASVLADSTLEHYRGGFYNKVMFIAPTVSAATLVASLHGRSHHGSPQSVSRNALRASIFSAAFASGLVGTAFHIYNIYKRDGKFDWENLFYAAPLGAPAAITLAGAFGWMSERASESARPPRVLGLPLGRTVGAVAAIGLIGNAAEVCLLHFRGAFQNPFMYLPVSMPPIAILALAHATLSNKGEAAPRTRQMLALTAAMGCTGVGFHAYGISRNMGGWKNWSQMLLQGPPLPAPPSFTGLAFVGLGAIELIEAGA